MIYRQKRYKTPLVVTSLSGLIAIACAIATAGPEPSGTEAILALMQQRDYAAASKLIEAEQRVSPDSVYAVSLAGLMHLARGEASAALSGFQDGVRRSPNESLL